MNSTNITFSLLEKIERVNEDFALFHDCRKILVGLSGGADSTCLLLALKQLSKKYGFELYALHVNHMIRGEEADRDEEFVRKLCEQNGIELVCVTRDVPSLANKTGQSLELCARNVRYEAFRDICRQKGITAVATAHNACDNAETVLFNLTRGTGIKGLCGIPPKRDLCEGVCLIRPLLYCERNEIEEYLAKVGQDYVTDSTNFDIDYTRNYIRHEILPHLRKINPATEQSMLRTSLLVRNDEQYLSSTAQALVTDDLSVLCGLHESVLSRVVIELFSRVSDETPSEIHVKNLCRKIYSYNGTKSSVSFPDSMSARLYRGKLSFEKDSRKKKSDTATFDVQVRDGEVFFEENPYALYITFDQTKDIPQTLRNKEIIYKKYTTDYLYFDKIPDVFCIRNRRDADKIKSGMMNKSIKRLMTGSPYSEKERYLVPFVCDREKILLVPGVARNDDCNKTDKAGCVSVTLYRAGK